MTNNPPQRFKLEFTARVAQVDEDGRPMNSYYNNGLEVKDTLDLGALDFMGVAGVLAQFHTLASRIAEVNQKEK